LICFAHCCRRLRFDDVIIADTIDIMPAAMLAPCRYCRFFAMLAASIDATPCFSLPAISLRACSLFALLILLLIWLRCLLSILRVTPFDDSASADTDTYMAMFLRCLARRRARARCRVTAQKREASPPRACRLRSC